MLCSETNHTYIMLNLMFKEIIDVINRNEISGILGSCADYLLIRKSKYRKCSVIMGDKLGDRLENNTYTGVLGKLQNHEVDLYLKGESRFFDPNNKWLHQTSMIKTEKIIAGHLIFNEKLHYFDLVDNFKIELKLFLIYILFIILSFTFYLLLVNFKYRKLKFKTYKFNYLFNICKNRVKLSSISLFLLFLSLFYWFTFLFLTVSIKTNTVVVDTSNLIKNFDDLINTKKTACFLEGETEVTIGNSLPKNSLLSRLLNEKTYYKPDQNVDRSLYGDRCFISRHKLLPNNFFKNDWFLIGTETARLLSFLFFEQTNLPFCTWSLNNYPITEFSVVLFFSMRNSMNKQFINLSIKYVEYGIFTKMYSCFTQNTELKISKSIRNFNSLDDYLNEYSKFNSLDIVNFKSIFLIYFIVCLICILIYLIEFLFKILNKLIYKLDLINL